MSISGPEATIPRGLIDPTQVSFMAGAGAVLDYTDLSDAELVIFERDLRRLASSLQSLSRELGSYFLAKHDAFLWGAAIAKRQFLVPFRGLVALGSGTFGMQLIRAVTVTPGNSQTWLQTLATTGWGSKNWNVNLATSTGTVTNTFQRVILLAPWVANVATTPKVKEIRWTVGPTTYAINVIDLMKLSNLFITELPGSLLVLKNGTFTADFNVETTGVDGTSLLGVAYATGDWLQLET